MTDVLATTAELEALRKAAGIPHLPTQLTFEARLAISGEGPRAYDWSDKPHRIVFDLCREIEKNAAGGGNSYEDEAVERSVWNILTNPSLTLDPDQRREDRDERAMLAREDDQ